MVVENQTKKEDQTEETLHLTNQEDVDKIQPAAAASRRYKKNRDGGTPEEKSSYLGTNETAQLKWTNDSLYAPAINFKRYV